MLAVAALFHALSNGPLPALSAELFPTKTRNTAMAVSYHISTGVFGGITPFILTMLSHNLGESAGPALFLTVTCAIGFLSVVTLSTAAAGKKKEESPWTSGLYFAEEF